MKSAIPAIAHLAAPVLAVALFATGCSDPASTTTKTPPGTLTAGNWVLMPRSNLNLLATDGHLRGLAKVSSSSVTMNVQMTASGNDSGICLPQAAPVTLSGADSSGALKLAWQSTSTTQPESLAIAAAVNPDNSVLGTYAVSGACADTGTIYGVFVPSITGTWAGTPKATNLGTGATETVTMTATVAQASVPSAANQGPSEALPLSGTVTVSTANCTASAKIPLTLDPTQSYITGELVSIVAASADGLTQLDWYAALTDPTTSKSMLYSSFAGSNPSLTTSTCTLNFATSAQLDLQ